MDNVKDLLLNDIAALNRLTINGVENCFIVLAVSNDLKRILEHLEAGEEKAKEEEKDVEAS